jgi:hypothetical protein
VCGQYHAPAALPPGKTRYPLYRRRDGPQGRSGRVRKTWPPPGFDPRTVQLVASRYTDWAIRPTHGMYILIHDVIWYDMIWYGIPVYLTVVGLAPGGSTTFTHKQCTEYREWNIHNNKPIGNCGLCPVFAGYKLVFALQLRKKHGKTSIRVAVRTSQADTVQYKNNEYYNTQKNCNTEQYNVTEQHRILNTQQRKQSISGK